MEDEAAEVEDDEDGGDGDGDDGGGGKEGGGDDSEAVGGDGGAYEGEEVEVEAGAQAELEHHYNAVSKTQAVVLKRTNQESLLAMRTYSGRLDLTWDEAQAEVHGQALEGEGQQVQEARRGQEEKQVRHGCWTTLDGPVMYRL